MSIQPPAGYAYIRHSTKRQGGEDKDSVTRQKESIRILAEQYAVDIPDDNFFYENGVSAFSGKNRTHGKLKDLIDQIDSLRIRPGDYVFVESIDRLSRQRLLQAKELVNGILEKGIILVTTIDNQRYEKASEKNGIDDLSQDILLSVIAKRAHEESRTKSVRRLSAWTKAKKLADEVQKPFNAKRPPFGVQYNETTGKFEPNPEQVDELTRVFESLRLQGVTSTIKEINKTSKVRWTQNRVKDIFEKKYPLGFMYSQIKVDGKMQFDKYIENYYPQIISYELFEQARQAMQERKVKKRVGRASVGHVNIFRHTAQCGQCGESMFFMHNFGSRRNHYYYLSCRSNFEKVEKCNNRIRYDFAVKILFDIIKDVETVYTLNSINPNQAMMTHLAHDLVDNIDQFIEKSSALGKEETTDELIVQETERTEKSLRGNLALGERFSKIMMGNDETKEYHKQKIIVENELHKRKIRLENLERSAEAIQDGSIPAFLLKNIVIAESDVKESEAKRAELASLAAMKKSELRIETLEQFKKLFREEQGRLEIIHFLVSHGMSFKFNYNKETQKMVTVVSINNEEISTIRTLNDGKFLEPYGFKNLGEEFKLFE